MAPTLCTLFRSPLICGRLFGWQLVPDIPNPFIDKVHPRFIHTLNKLHLWNMARYERVMYLDADVVATAPLQPLFGCGRLCVVYMNPCHFHTALMVVKPDPGEFDRLMFELNNGSRSHDGADQGFLSYMCVWCWVLGAVVFWVFSVPRVLSCLCFVALEPTKHYCHTAQPRPCFLQRLLQRTCPLSSRPPPPFSFLFFWASRQQPSTATAPT